MSDKLSSLTHRYKNKANGVDTARAARKAKRRQGQTWGQAVWASWPRSRLRNNTTWWKDGAQGLGRVRSAREKAQSGSARRVSGRSGRCGGHLRRKRGASRESFLLVFAQRLCCEHRHRSEMVRTLFCVRRGPSAPLLCSSGLCPFSSAAGPRVWRLPFRAPFPRVRLVSYRRRVSLGRAHTLASCSHRATECLGRALHSWDMY